MSAPPITGAWSEAVVSVRDLDRWTEALDNLFGWRAAAKNPVDPRLLAAWGLPPGCAAEDVILTEPSDTSRRVRLIRFDHVPQVQIRSSAMAWEPGGIFSLLCHARDVDATFAAAQDLGWSAFNDPVDMHFEGRTLRNVVLRAWDGANFGLYRLMTPAPPTLNQSAPAHAKVAMAFNGQQMIRDIAPARAFYADILGWTAWFDGVTHLTCNNFGMPENFVGKMPKNVIIAAGGKDANGAWAHGQVELVQWVGFTGRDLGARAVPPNLGILGLRIPVSDVRAKADEITKRGGTLFYAPVTVAPAPQGETTQGETIMCAVRTPDGAMIEFVQAA
jgi:catechol 2,3-dioxygenase-like lactoylglutathione lyase family enzyme